MPSFSSALPAPRFVNPMLLWLELGVTAQETLACSGAVIQKRSERLARAALSPTLADLEELQLMGQEKFVAVAEAGHAMARQLHTTQFTLMPHAARQWLAGSLAWFSLVTSTSAAEVAAQATAFAHAATKSAATASQLGGAGAHILQRGLEPIHSKARANAQRLATSS